MQVGTVKRHLVYETVVAKVASLPVCVLVRRSVTWWSHICKFYYKLRFENANYKFRRGQIPKAAALRWKECPRPKNKQNKIKKKKKKWSGSFVLQFGNNLGDRSFSCAAPSLWNLLPSTMGFISSLRSRLKTFLFSKAFN